jgi:DNA-binding transcriptional ArsR family regulator
MVKSEARLLDAIFHALADATRRSILMDIARREKSVGEIAKPYRMSLAAVSKHLKVLGAARLIERRKRGSYQIVSLNPAALKTAEQWLAYHQRFWDDRLDALKNLLEKDEP